MNILDTEKYSELRAAAISCGFTSVGQLDPKTIALRADVRSACSENKCGQYGVNWSCPPGCGSLEQCGEAIRPFENGLLLQTTGQLEDNFDAETMMETAKTHAAAFRKFARYIREVCPKVLILADGTCSICPECTYPKHPCRFPELKTSSMEAFGILVSDVCAQNKLPYYYGLKTITYTGCVLF